MGKQMRVGAKQYHFIGLLILFCCFVLSCSEASMAEATVLFNTSPSLLSSIDFPKIEIAYPAAWREAYRLPDSFQLVQAEVCEHDCTFAIYSGQFISDDPETVALRNISAYIDSLGWERKQRIFTQSEAVYISAHDLSGTGSCMIIVSADPESGTRVLLTMNP